MAFTAVELAAFFSVAKDASISGLLLFILWGGSRQVWLWGHHYIDAVRRVEEARQEVQWWQERHLGLLETANRAVSLADGRRRH